MEWLSQNWIWIAVAIGALYFMTRMRGMSSGRGHAMGRGDDGAQADRGIGPNTVFDPVSRRMIAPGGASISAVYHDRAYYFETREDREAFEADPEKYIAGAPGAGQVIGLADAHREQPRRRGGC